MILDDFGSPIIPSGPSLSPSIKGCSNKMLVTDTFSNHLCHQHHFVCNMREYSEPLNKSPRPHHIKLNINIGVEFLDIRKVIIKSNTI